MFQVLCRDPGILVKNIGTILQKHALIGQNTNVYRLQNELNKDKHTNKEWYTPNKHTERSTNEQKALTNKHDTSNHQKTGDSTIPERSSFRHDGSCSHSKTRFFTMTQSRAFGLFLQSRPITLFDKSNGWSPENIKHDKFNKFALFVD